MKKSRFTFLKLFSLERAAPHHGGQILLAWWLLKKSTESNWKRKALKGIRIPCEFHLYEEMPDFTCQLKHFVYGISTHRTTVISNDSSATSFQSLHYSPVLQ
ncbi:hypothetical protein A4A49_23277 [Nicotiana attenuata]|uniref:Uncharacterized protein n=1 Tax=Nicotiana attenuata TaxID=49451 RepID=A0A1J6I9M7_NICAT|nr:hypothetical protein A4A49_23277 [Nicotiana attenuata]